MKRKISILALSALLMFGVSGCSDWLDLRPNSQIILDEFWQSEQDVESVLASCYRGLTEDAVVYRMIVWGELRSDNMVPGSGFPNERRDMDRILQGDILSTNAYANWGAFYSVINYCNTLIHYAPDVVNRDDNFTQGDLNRVLAEARAIRALSYFYLVRAFKEVPWVEEPSIDDTKDYNQPKNTERFLIDKIIEDLLEARKYARTDFGRVEYNKGRITLNAVNAILADVYLWDGQYQNCVDACDLVMADKNLKLVNSDFYYTRVFYNGNSTESIFELQFSENVQKNNPVFELYGSSGVISGEVSFPATLAYNPEETDLTKSTGSYSPFNYKVSTTVIESAKDQRAKDSYNVSLASTGKYYIFKYAGMSRTETAIGGDPKSSYRYRVTTPNWIIYRLSDLMLMKAEALVQLEGEANNKQAIELVNHTYLRSNESDSIKLVNYQSKNELEKLVLRERQRELLFEGKRWFDLVRMARREKSTSMLNKFVESKATGTTNSLGAPVLDAMYMPISRSEIEANKKLEQNPYYAETGSSSER